MESSQIISSSRIKRKAGDQWIHSPSKRIFKHFSHVTQHDYFRINCTKNRILIQKYYDRIFQEILYTEVPTCNIDNHRNIAIERYIYTILEQCQKAKILVKIDSGEYINNRIINLLIKNLLDATNDDHIRIHCTKDIIICDKEENEGFCTVFHANVSMSISMSEHIMCLILSKYKNSIISFEACQAEYVTDKIMQFLRNCATIISFSLNECLNVTDLSLKMVTAKCQELNKLFLYNMDQVFPSTVIWFVKTSKSNLRLITLIGTKLVNVAVINAIIDNCTSRNICLNISGNNEITDNVICRLLEECPLASLILTVCPITGEAFYLNKISTLKMININYCSYDCFHILQQAISVGVFPYLESLYYNDEWNNNYLVKDPITILDNTTLEQEQHLIAKTYI